MNHEVTTRASFFRLRACWHFKFHAVTGTI